MICALQLRRRFLCNAAPFSIVGALTAVFARADIVRLVRDITQDGPTESSFPRRFVEVGNRAVFVANQPQTGAELWSTDGTPQGTIFLGDLTPGPTGTFLSTTFQTRLILFPLGPNVFFRGPGATLWKTDGTPQGTVLVSSAVTPESIVSSNNDADRNPVYADLNGMLIFSGTDAAAGRELW